MRNKDIETVFKKTEVWKNLETRMIEYEDIFFSKIYSPDSYLVDEKS